MKRFGRDLRLLVAIAAVFWVGPVLAQENLEAGKTPPQIFASDCAGCHKTPYGLAQRLSSPFGGLAGFLRQHFTASRETAAVLARYLESVGEAPPQRRVRTQRARKPPIPKPNERTKTDAADGDKKTDEAKAGDAKSEDAKSAAAKPTGDKPAASKPAEANTEPAKASGDKPSAEKSADAKPAEARPEAAKSSQSQSSNAQGAKPADSKTEGAKTGGAN